MKRSTSDREKVRFFSRSSVRLCISGFTGILLFAVFSVGFSARFRDRMIDLRKRELERLVTLGQSAIVPVLHDLEAGVILRETALERVRDTIRRMVYRDSSGRNYLFMSAYDGTMLVQPFERQLEGTPQWDLRDAYGTYIIRSLVEKAKQGGGFVEYYYYVPDEIRPKRKISYVVPIPALECYLGTGLYLDDLSTFVFEYVLSGIAVQAAAILLIAAVTVILLLPFYRSYSLVLARARTILRDPGALSRSFDIPFKPGTEAWLFLRDFKDMLGQLEANRKALEGERRLMKLLIDNLPGFVYMKDGNGRYIEANRMTLDFVGRSEEQVLGKTDFEFFPEETARRLQEEDSAVLEAGRLIDFGESVLAFRGKEIPILKKKVPMSGEDGRPIGVLGLAFDISVLKDVHARLEESLREKEALLKEVHHRVKNNLQIVSSLLNLQGGAVTDESVKAVLRESGSRVHSMALVHELLYSSEKLRDIDMAKYLREIVSGLLQLFSPAGAAVMPVYRLEPLSLGLDSAILTGLIATELTTNSLKYAFPGGRRGELRVALYLSGDQIVLEVADDGVGFSGNILDDKKDSLGLVLVKALTQQLGGTISASGSGGAVFTVRFPRP